jgi:hypothetical protein
LHLLHQRLHLILVCALNLARLANRQVQRKLDSAMDAGAQPAAARRHVLRRHADAVLARVRGAESEAALRGAALRNDAVVVVKGFFDGDEDADVAGGLVGFGLVGPGFGVVVAWISSAYCEFTIYQ